MGAQNTDKFKKLSRRWVGQIGSGGVADDVVTTIPLSSATDLPTDTAVVAVIDRVDANGAETPTLEESVIGVVSGSNLIDCVRGVEGTAQAHSAGAVVEILFTAKGWNDVIDGILTEHNQDGTHSSIQTGWTPARETWSYKSADDPTYVFDVNADVTAKYSVGMKIKLTQTTGGTKYAIITAIGSFSGGKTPITCYFGTDYDLENETISNPYYSTMKAPKGFPLDPDKWSIKTTNTSILTQNNPANGTWYNIGSLNIVIPIGAWEVSYKVVIDAYKATGTAYDIYSALSTANDSASDAELKASSYITTGTGTDFINTHFAQKNLTLAAKTTYYLNAMSNASSIATLQLRGDRATTIIKAICAYL